MAGVTEGFVGDTSEALTHQTATLQGDHHSSPSPAVTGIHWERWPAVTMVSDGSQYSKTVNDPLKIKSHTDIWDKLLLCFRKLICIAICFSCVSRF